MFERYTDRAKRAVELAREEAADLVHGEVGTDHLLLGLIAEGGGVAFQALGALGVTAEAASEAVCRHHKPGTRRTDGHLPWTPRFRKVQELALRESIELGDNFIATEHLLLGLVREGGGVGALALADCGTAEGDRGFSDVVRAKVLELLRGYAEGERTEKAAAPAARDAGTEIEVVMTPGIQPAFKVWPASRGLYLFPIPAEDDRLPAFGIGIR